MLKTGITGISPETVSSLNMRIYVSNTCPSTNRSQRRPAIQRKASRRPQSRDDEQLRALLASPLYIEERGESAERSQVYHSEREILMSSSSQDPTSTGKPVAVFPSQNRLNQDTFSDRDEFSFTHQQVFGNNELFIRFSNQANVAEISS